MTLALWGVVAGVLLGACVAAVVISGRFAAGLPASGMPILTLTFGLVSIGLVFLSTVPLVWRSLELSPVAARRLLVWIFTFGIAMRCVLLASEPMLEVDFNRYLWDGGLTARGLDPYAIAPADAAGLAYDDPRLELSKAAGPVFEQISYPELRTIYPPVAQAAFAVAHLLAPWSLTAWRGLCLAGEVATFLLLVALLKSVDRSPLWSALYWWCPLVLKETANSAHMEAILMPLVLAALWLAGRRRHLAATAMLGLAIGAKLWPVVLVPLLLRPLVSRPLQLAGAVALLAAMLAAFAIPIVAGGLDAGSGFVAFARHWTTNSALLPALEQLASAMLGVAASESPRPGLVVRFAMATVVAGVAIGVAWAPLRDAGDLAARATTIVTVLLLASPAQFPWYLLWVLPLAILQAGSGWMLATVTMPLYYLAFHLQARGDYALFERWIVWAIWLPVWLALARDAWHARGDTP